MGKTYKQENILRDKALIQIWWRDKKFYRQAKTKRVEYTQTNFTGNVKRTGLRKKEKATIRNMEIMKGKSSLVKQIQ